MARGRVALDGMGGDNAPAAPVSGALDASRPRGYTSCSWGTSGRSGRSWRARARAADPGIELVHAPDVISSGEEGARAVRAKPEVVGVAPPAAWWARGGRAPPSRPGNTGAMLAAATLYMRRVPGVIRPAIAVVLPSAGGGAGGAARRRRQRRGARRALPPARPDGAALRPRRAGRRPSRASGSCRSARRRARAARSCWRPTPCCATRPGFVGNVEGRDISGGAIDVVVTDGFTGNVVLKTMEGVAAFLMGEVRQAVRRRRTLGRIGGAAGAAVAASHARSHRPRDLRRRGAAGRARARRDRPRELHRPRASRTPCAWPRRGTRERLVEQFGDGARAARAPNAPRRRRIPASSRGDRFVRDRV